MRALLLLFLAPKHPRIVRKRKHKILLYHTDGPLGYTIAISSADHTFILMQQVKRGKFDLSVIAL